MEWFCGKGRRGMSKPIFDLAMARMSSMFGDIAVRKDARTPPFPTLFHEFFQFENVSMVQESSSSNYPRRSAFYHPSSVHVNFCDNKQQCFESLGLWLLKESPFATKDNDTTQLPHHKSFSCSRFDIRRTTYSKVSWSKKLEAARKELDHIASTIKSGEVVQIPPSATLFLYKDGYLVPIVDTITFKELGFQNFSMVKRLLNPVFQFLPYADPIKLSPYISTDKTIDDKPENVKQLAVPVSLTQQHLSFYDKIIFWGSSLCFLCLFVICIIP